MIDVHRTHSSQNLHFTKSILWPREEKPIGEALSSMLNVSIISVRSSNILAGMLGAGVPSRRAYCNKAATAPHENRSGSVTD